MGPSRDLEAGTRVLLLAVFHAKQEGAIAETNKKMEDMETVCKQRNIPSLALGNVEMGPPAQLCALLGDMLANPHPSHFAYSARRGAPIFLDGVRHMEQTRYGHALSEACLMACSGVSGGVVSTLVALRREGRVKVGVADPCYSFHRQQIQLIMGCDAILVETDDNFRLQPARLEEKLAQGMQAFLLSNPANPTGSVYGELEMTVMLELCERYNCVLIVDEIYRELLWDAEHRLYSPIQRPTAPSPHLIVVRGFSKSLGLASWRLGYLIGNPQRVALISECHEKLFVSMPAQQLALGTYLLHHLDDFESHLRNLKASMAQSREILAAAFEHRFGWRALPTQGAMFQLFQHQERSDADAVENALAAGVGVTPGHVFFGAPRSCSGLVRIHVGVTLPTAIRIADSLLRDLERAQEVGGRDHGDQAALSLVHIKRGETQCPQP